MHGSKNDLVKDARSKVASSDINDMTVRRTSGSLCSRYLITVSHVWSYRLCINWCDDGAARDRMHSHRHRQPPATSHNRLGPGWRGRARHVRFR